jgi:hypothetical protein
LIQITLLAGYKPKPIQLDTNAQHEEGRWLCFSRSEVKVTALMDKLQHTCVALVLLS